MRRYLLHIIVLSVCLRPSAPLSAQGRSPRSGGTPRITAPTLKATVDKEKILIGEPIQLMLEATVYGDGAITWPLLDSLPHFEWVEKHAVDSAASAGQRQYRQFLTVTSFDSGTWAIPRLPFTVGSRTFYSDSVRINVIYTKIDPSKDYHDIKDIIEVPNSFAHWFGWIVALVAILSVAGVVWLVRKKTTLKQLFTPRQVPLLSPYEEAIRDLDELSARRLVENGAVKTFYSRLGDILRVYLYRRTGIASLSETSEELIGQLRRQSLPAQQFSDLSDALRMSDFVKFAKYQPGAADSEFHYVVIRGTIEELNRRLDAEEKAQAAIDQQKNTQ
jgi:hypothetical protein